MKFPESKLAHHYLDPLAELGSGIEIGGSAHNPFNIKNCKNVDFTDSLDTIFKQEEIKLCGEALPVDVVSFADELPFADSSQNYLINCHLFEHLPNPIRALVEWYRVCKPNAIIVSTIPYKHVTPADERLPLTTLDHIIKDFVDGETCDTHPLEEGHGKYGHLHRFNPKTYLSLIDHVNQMFDEPLFLVIDHQPMCEKCPNGFVYFKRVLKDSGEKLPVFYNNSFGKW